MNVTQFLPDNSWTIECNRRISNSPAPAALAQAGQMCIFVGIRIIRIFGFTRFGILQFLNLEISNYSAFSNPANLSILQILILTILAKVKSVRKSGDLRRGRVHAYATD